MACVSCQMMEAPMASVGIAAMAANASRWRVLEGSNVIRHNREPGLHMATSNASAAIAATRIQSMAKGTCTFARASVIGTIAPRSSWIQMRTVPAPTALT